MRADADHPEATQLLREFVAGVLGRPVDVMTSLTPDERALLFRHLSRADELGKKRRPGERIVWTAQDLAPAARESLPIPHLDNFVAALRQRLPTPFPGSAWPENRPFAVCLSHDMDHVTAFVGRERWRRFSRRQRQGGAGVAELLKLAGSACRSTVATWVKRDLQGRRDRFDNVGDWLKLEEDCGFKSSLYFFAETVAPCHPNDCDYGFDDRVQFEGRPTTVGTMMREIATRGWDVGVHGSVASATESGVLAIQKREVETVIGQRVTTTRQHYLQYDPNRTAALQAEAGFLADGTQGFNDTIGFRAGTSFPYRVWDWTGNRLLPLWQVPLHVQDGPLMRQAKTADEAVARCVQMLDTVERTGGCLGLLFHPFHLAMDAGHAVYREVLQEARRRRAWGCSMREAAEWWQERTRAVLGQPELN